MVWHPLLPIVRKKKKKHTKRTHKKIKKKFKKGGNKIVLFKQRIPGEKKVEQSDPDEKEYSDISYVLTKIVLWKC